MEEFKRFSKDVDTTSREAMVYFLTNHFRYNTANSWNGQTSYANNIKIYNLGVSEEVEEKLWNMRSYDYYFECVDFLIDDFAERHNYKYQIGVNGRSDGYLVLYKGDRKKLDYKSRCTECRQLSYAEATENDCKCGRCGELTRVNLKAPLYESHVKWESIDQYEDFEDWSDNELRERVKLVRDFDETCDEIIGVLIEQAMECKVVEEEIMVPRKVKTLVACD